jgi:hypothetical protein
VNGEKADKYFYSLKGKCPQKSNFSTVSESTYFFNEYINIFNSKTFSKFIKKKRYFTSNQKGYLNNEIASLTYFVIIQGFVINPCAP